MYPAPPVCLVFYYTQIVDERKSLFREEFQIINVEEKVELKQNKIKQAITTATTSYCEITDLGNITKEK